MAANCWLKKQTKTYNKPEKHSHVSSEDNDSEKQRPNVEESSKNDIAHFVVVSMLSNVHHSCTETHREEHEIHCYGHKQCSLTSVSRHSNV